ncbi:hypothetical protein CRUP_027224 [Coryphaenoides rupestris]|nr:hypothetical protein CRUP_027224 [Coryphaenoides rupestris]
MPHFAIMEMLIAQPFSWKSRLVVPFVISWEEEEEEGNRPRHEVPSTPWRGHEVPRTPRRGHEVPRTPRRGHEVPRTPRREEEEKEMLAVAGVVPMGRELVGECSLAPRCLGYVTSNIKRWISSTSSSSSSSSGGETTHTFTFPGIGMTNCCWGERRGGPDAPPDVAAQHQHHRGQDGRHSHQEHDCRPVLGGPVVCTGNPTGKTV